MPALSTPPVNKTHTWILVLLFWILAISIFVAGYLITQNNQSKIVALSPTELQSQCTTAGFVDKATIQPVVTTSSSTTGSCPTPADIIVEANQLFPGFSYPSGWSVNGGATDPNNSGRYYITVNSGPNLQYCIGCDAPGAPISFNIAERDEAALGAFSTFESYVSSLNQPNPEFTNIAITPFTVTEGLQGFEVTGHQNGMGSDDVDLVYVLTPKHLIIVANSRLTTDNATGWGIIKSSLDFSKVN